ncbi:MAG: tetratricopeptide repeat protein [Planctomycetota bacterium]|jgi:hypothetical protein
MFRTILIVMIFLLTFESAVGGETSAARNGADLETVRDYFKGLAETAYREKRWNECIRNYGEYLGLFEMKIQGLSAEISFRMGVSSLRINDLPEARKYLFKVVEDLDPEFPDAYIFIAEYHAQCGMNLQMRRALLDAASFGYDVIGFLERSDVESAGRRKVRPQRSSKRSFRMSACFR